MAVSAVLSLFLVLCIWYVLPAHDLMPEDILKLYTNGTIMRFTANVTNCLGSKMAKTQSISGSLLGGVTSAGSVHSESHGTWFLGFGSQKHIKGKFYNKTESVIRLTSLTLNEEGTVYVNVYDVDHITGKILAYAHYFCSIGQTKPEVTFIPNKTKRSTLMTYNDVLAAVLSGKQVTFSVNVDGSRPDAFRYWFGKIQDFEINAEDEIVFTVMVPSLGYNSVFTARIARTGCVAMETYTVNSSAQTVSDKSSYKDSIEDSGYFRIYTTAQN